MTSPLTPTRTIFTKTYRDVTRRAAAVRHLRFLTDACAAAGTPASIRLPALVGEDGPHLVMERLDGVPAHPTDLPAVATAMGYLHAATFDAGLHGADLDRPFTVDDWAIPSFFQGRQRVLDAMPIAARRGPAAIYKDFNVHNVLVQPAPRDHAATLTTPTAGHLIVGVVDFDDLTLAPFGYDLAKLLLSAAMTYGPAPRQLYEECRDSYNDAVATAATDAPTRARGCSIDDLVLFAEIHHMLTAKYLGRRGYRHAWPDVRPWPAP